MKKRAETVRAWEVLSRSGFFAVTDDHENAKELARDCAENYHDPATVSPGRFISEDDYQRLVKAAKKAKRSTAA